MSGLLALRLTRLYQLDSVVDSLTLNTAVLRAGALQLVASLAGADLAGIDIDHRWLAGASGLAVVLLCLTRDLNRRLTLARRTDGYLLRRVLLFGTNAEALAFRQTVEDHPATGLHVVAAAGRNVPGSELGAGVSWVGSTLADALGAIETHRIDAVFVVPSAMTCDELTRLRRVMAERHMPVHLVHSPESLAGSRFRQTRVGLSYLSHVELEPPSGMGRCWKRGLDLALGMVLALVTAPVMMVVALAILLVDGRPVFFRQMRVGRDLHPFRLVKFRTMTRDAESRVEELRSRNERQGPLFKLAEDPRVTRIGRLLRATSLDELPQLFNVLAGHMSLVGPRPAMPSEVAHFDEELRSRHRMRPGVTGLWQVRSRDETEFESYQRLDLFYVENWSLAMDVSILAATGPAVVVRAFVEIRRARSRPSRERADVARYGKNTRRPLNTIAPLPAGDQS